MATETLNLRKNIQKSSPQKPQGEWAELDFTEMFITFASTKGAFLLPLLVCFRRYGNVHFP